MITATISAAANIAAVIGPRLSEDGAVATGSCATGTDRLSGCNRALISVIEHLRLGSRCRHSRAMPRNGSGIAAGRPGSFAASLEKGTLCVSEATTVAPSDQMSLAGER